jgi:hypothetical protein
MYLPFAIYLYCSKPVLSVRPGLLLGEITKSIVGHMIQTLLLGDHTPVFFSQSSFVLAYRAGASAILTTPIAVWEYNVGETDVTSEHLRLTRGEAMATFP